MTRNKKHVDDIPYTLEDWMKIHYPDILNEYEKLVDIL